MIADGGIRRDGSIAEALMFGGDSVMLGSAFAGTAETPGEIVLKSVLEPESQKIVKVPFKVFRGMASISAIRDRLDLEEADPREVEAIGAEGLEVSVPARGSSRGIIRNMLKHLSSDQLWWSADSAGVAGEVPGVSGAICGEAHRGVTVRVVSALKARGFNSLRISERRVQTSLKATSTADCRVVLKSYESLQRAAEDGLVTPS